ncbi:FecCD family ABC transporter permease [Clostridium sp.]|uniref:FecCD family ABC transporter permease n=1 Tax=Clostridium sp. TaxID=1506 RepID=UPI00399482F3
MEKNKEKNNERFAFWVMILLALLIISVIICIAIGSTYIDPKVVYNVLGSKLTGSHNFSESIETIIWEIRVPRVILGLVTGAGLATCGVLMQCVTRNPIADPYILGISSGASAGAVFIIVFGSTVAIGSLSVAFGAFIGAILCGIMVFVIGTQWGRSTSTTRLVLSGLAISTIFSAITNIIIYSAKNSNQAKSAMFWIMGSLGGGTYEKLYLPIIILLIVIILSIFLSKSMDLLLFGDDSAIILGMNVKLVKSVIILLATILTASLVAITGAIGFIGLVIPHVCRHMSGSSHRKLIILSSITGAIFLIWADAIARSAFSPREIPIGIITSLIGGPFFLWLISKNEYSFGGRN